MSLLASVTKGKIKKPVFVLVYGPDGVGKSSFGAASPGALFMGTEDGTSNLDVARLPAPTSFTQCLTAIEELTNANHDYKTLVIDSLDWLEPILHREMCKEFNQQNVETIMGGYGKWVSVANDRWHNMIGKLKQLREVRKMNIIALAHSEIKNFQNPQTSVGYDRYQLKLNQKASAIWREAVEAVLFANYEVFTAEKNGRTKAYGEGARMLYTEHRPAFDAKNRYGLPFKMPLSWNDFMTAVDSGAPTDPAKIRESIMGLLENIADPELKKIVLETLDKAGSNAANLEIIKNRLIAKLEG